MRSRFPEFVVTKENTALKGMILAGNNIGEKGKEALRNAQEVLALSKSVVMYFSVCAIYFVCLCMCHVFASSELDSDRS